MLAKIISIASSRKDCIAFVSPHRANIVGVSSALDQTNNVVGFFDTLESTSYAVFDSGYKYIYDRFADKYRYVPCNPDVAGLCAAVTANGTPWFSPAGLNRGAIKGAVKLAYSPTKSQRDTCIRTELTLLLLSLVKVLFSLETKLLSLHHPHLIASTFAVSSGCREDYRQRSEGVLFEVNDEFTKSELLQCC